MTQRRPTLVLVFMFSQTLILKSLDFISYFLPEGNTGRWHFMITWSPWNLVWFVAPLISGAAPLSWEETMGGKECQSRVGNNAALAWAGTPVRTQQKAGQELKEMSPGYKPLLSAGPLGTACTGNASASFRDVGFTLKALNGIRSPVALQKPTDRAIECSKSSRRWQSLYIHWHCTQAQGRSWGGLWRPCQFQGTRTPSLANTLKISHKKKEARLGENDNNSCSVSRWHMEYENSPTSKVSTSWMPLTSLLLLEREENLSVLGTLLTSVFQPLLGSGLWATSHIPSTVYFIPKRLKSLQLMNGTSKLYVIEREKGERAQLLPQDVSIFLSFSSLSLRNQG